LHLERGRRIRHVGLLGHCRKVMSLGVLDVVGWLLNGRHVLPLGRLRVLHVVLLGHRLRHSASERE
jgi:hypothetical protein